MIRKAGLQDVKKIHRLIIEQAQSGHILARPISEIYAKVRDFVVAEDDASGVVIGCGALQIVWEDLAEIRSLAVRTADQKRGVGSSVIEWLIDEARSMGVIKVFVLTNREKLFERAGFQVMDKGLLPHKIWADCVRCTKFPECDEIAMVKPLSEIHADT